MHLKHFLQTGLLAATLAAGAAQAQNVVLYSSNNTETIETALDAVKKQSPKLNVQPVTGGTGTMMKRIEAEAQNPRGDLFWSGGFGTLGAYRQHLQPYRPADIDKAVTLGLNYPHGPLKFGDVLGPDRVHKVLASMFSIYGDPRYRPNVWLTRRARLGVGRWFRTGHPAHRVFHFLTHAPVALTAFIVVLVLWLAGRRAEAADAHAAIAARRHEALVSLGAAVAGAVTAVIVLTHTLTWTALGPLPVTHGVLQAVAPDWAAAHASLRRCRRTRRGPRAAACGSRRKASSARPRPPGSTRRGPNRSPPAASSPSSTPWCTSP